MPVRRGKPILGLIVLLAWPALGSGGRAEAGLAFHRSALDPAWGAAAPPDPILDLARNPPRQSVREVDTPGVPLPQPERGAAPATHSGPLGGSSGQQGPGGSAPFLPPSDSRGLTPEGNGRALLADEQANPPPFPSRLFRPPR